MALSSLDRLTKHIARLPGIGERTAFRLALHLFYTDQARLDDFADALVTLREGITLCRECYTLTETDPCALCSDATRNRTIVCVVEDYGDLIAIEKTNEYKGRYHVLHGLIAPLKGVSAGDIKIKELIERISRDGITELIFAFDAGLEGDTTAHYIAKRALDAGAASISRIAYGIALGSDIEHADARSLARSLHDRAPYAFE